MNSSGEITIWVVSSWHVLLSRSTRSLGPLSLSGSLGNGGTFEIELKSVCGKLGLEVNTKPIPHYQKELSETVIDKPPVKKVAG